MSEITVRDFLADPDLLAQHEPLDDEQLSLIGDLSINVEMEMPLADLIEFVQIATGHSWPGSP